MAHVELASVEEPICTWTEASRKFSVHLRPEVIRSLGTESWIAFKRVPRRGLEIGGILLGRKDSRGDTTTFWIEGSAPVESEHRSGPSYVLSESDFGHLQEALTKHAATSIGLYRSQTRSEQLVLQEPDVQLFRRCLDTSDALFLMLGPVPGAAALFIRSDGNLKCVHQFPLASSLSSSLALRQKGISPQVNLSAQPATEIQDAPASPVRQLDAPQEETLSVADHHLDHQPPPQNQDTFSSVACQTLDPPEKTQAPDVSGELLDRRRPLETALRTSFGPGKESLGTTAVDTSSSASGHRKWRIAVRLWLVKLSSAYRKRSSSLTKGAWILAAAFSLVLAARVGVRSYSSPRAAAPAAAAPVGRAPEYIHLSVERAGSSLRILWDRSSSALRGASRAVLHIQDGDSQSDRDLAPSEFDAGSVTYEPKSSELTFRLDVYSSGPNATGLVQVMNLASQPALNPDLSGEPKLKPRPQPPSHIPVTDPFIVRTELVSAHPPATKDDEKDAKNDAKEQIRFPATKSPDAITEEIRPSVVRPSDRTEAGSLDARAAPAPVVKQRSQTTPAAERAVPTSAPQPSVQVFPEAVSGSRLGRLVGKVPGLRRLRKPGKFVQPVPVFQTQPAFRMPDHQSLIQPVSVGVKVYVGESGAVQSAEVVDYGEPPNFSLSNAALAAARRWTFEPARFEDAPVSSEVILHFRFSP